MFASISKEGLKLIKTNHANSKVIGEKLSTLEKKMQTLKTYADARNHRLNEALEAHQVLTSRSETVYSLSFYEMKFSTCASLCVF